MASDSLLPKNDTHRKILHLDMDAFYASVEIRDHPELKNKAVVIARNPKETNGHGVIATANYLARRFGVGSAMPAIEAVHLIPHDRLVFVPPDFVKYRRVSQQVHQFMHEVSDQIEPIALDEAYLDITAPKLSARTPVQLGQYLQQKIYHELGLTCSFGISYNKFLAKMGSEYAKPFGATIISPEEAMPFLARQPLSRFPGIGKKTQSTLSDLGFSTGDDLQRAKIRFLLDRFKKNGYVMAMHAHGIDLRPVVAQRRRKSIGNERTFEPPLFTQERVDAVLMNFSIKLAGQLKQKKFLTDVIVLKVRNQAFVTVTKRQMLEQPTQEASQIAKVARHLLHQIPNFLDQGIRLLGISATHLQKMGYLEVPLPLFDQNKLQ